MRTTSMEHRKLTHTSTSGRCRHPVLRLVGTAAIAAFLDAFLTLACAADRTEVRFTGGQLAIEATDTPLETLLTSIADATGAQVEGRPASAPETMTVSLPPTPLDTALARLFPSASVAVSWRTDGRPTRIRWIGASDSAGMPREPVPVVHSLATPAAEPARHEAPESETQPPGAQPHEIAAYLRTSRHLRTLVAHRMKALDDAQALDALRAVAGDRTEGLLRAIAAEPSLGRIARRADRILEREVGR